MTLCRSLRAEALQETVSEGFAQSPYVAAKARFKPATLRSKGIDSTNAVAPDLSWIYFINQSKPQN